MKPNIAKYFWNFNKIALRDTEKILKNPYHPKFNERLITILSRCDKPKEVFSLISKKNFIEAWPGVRKYWKKISADSEFRGWWETIYEGLSRAHTDKKAPRGSPSVLFSIVGATIKQVRIRKKLSQSQLAFMIGAKQPDISKIEEGRKNITLDTLFRLCKALDIKELPVNVTKS